MNYNIFTRQDAVDELMFIIHKPSFKIPKSYTWQDIKKLSDNLISVNKDTDIKIQQLQAKFPFRKKY